MLTLPLELRQKILSHAFHNTYLFIKTSRPKTIHETIWFNSHAKTWSSDYTLIANYRDGVSATKEKLEEVHPRLVDDVGKVYDWIMLLARKYAEAGFEGELEVEGWKDVGIGRGTSGRCWRLLLEWQGREPKVEDDSEQKEE